MEDITTMPIDCAKAAGLNSINIRYLKMSYNRL